MRGYVGLTPPHTERLAAASLRARRAGGRYGYRKNRFFWMGPIPPRASLFEKAAERPNRGRPGCVSGVDPRTCFEICLDLHLRFSFGSVPNHSAQTDLIIIHLEEVAAYRGARVSESGGQFSPGSDGRNRPPASAADAGAPVLLTGRRGKKAEEPEPPRPGPLEQGRPGAEPLAVRGAPVLRDVKELRWASASWDRTARGVRSPETSPRRLDMLTIV